MQKLAKNLKSVTTVAIIDGELAKVSTAKSPADFSWNATRETVVKAKDVKITVTLDKDTVQERTFRYTDVDGKDIAECLGAANPTPTGGKGKKGDRGGIDPSLNGAEEAAK
jgi:hypothetical protein